MRVRYKAEFHVPFGIGKDVLVFKEVETEFCCEDMKSAWSDVICLGKDEYNNTEDTEHVNIKRQVYDCPDYIEILYCPFCGTKIALERKASVQLVAVGEKMVTTLHKETVYEERTI